jgi:hypothetical protein
LETLAPVEQTHKPIADVAKLILRVSQAADELGRQAVEVDQLRVVPEALLRFDHELARFNPDKHAVDLRAVVRSLRVRLASEEFGTEREWVEDYGGDPEAAYWTRAEDIDEFFEDP